MIIEPLIFDVDAKQPGELYWKENYKGAFKFVEYEKIFVILKERNC